MTTGIDRRELDFHNTRILLEKKEGQQIYADQGKLKLKSGRERLSKEDAKKVKELISSLLGRVEVGMGPLNEENVQSFVFEKIFPLHHRICDPSAMQKNPALRAVIAKRVEELKPDVAKDFNLVQCSKKIQKIQQRIARIEWALLNPIRSVRNLGDWVAGRKIDRELEKELEFLKWSQREEEMFSLALQEALLGLRMNLNHESSKENNGWSGSYFWRSYLRNETIGIYKPSDEDSISKGSPRSAARLRLRLIPSSNGVLVSHSEKSHIGERGARIAAEAFHQAYLTMKDDGIEMPFEELDAIVPDTRIVEVNFSSGATEHGIGSFQLFLKNSLPLNAAIGIDKNTYQETVRKKQSDFDQLLPQYQWLKLFHYLIFAQDDHAENTLAIQNAEGKITGLKAIDNGQSFLASPLKGGWIENRILSIKPLCGLRHPSTKNKMLPFFPVFLGRFRSGGFLKRLEKQLYELYQDPCNYPDGKTEHPEITASRIRLLKKRFRLLERSFVEQDLPLCALANSLNGDGINASRR